MNTYLIVEGIESEYIIYPKWIKLIDGKVKFVYKLEDVENDTILLMSGFGHPMYFEIIANAIIDIKDCNKFDRLVIVVDSEELSYNEKRKELEDYLNELQVPIPYEIIIQHFCLEAWALGNKKIYSRNSQNPTLRSYQKLFNVAANDPEELPPNKNDGLNRAKFASKYLVRLLQEKYRGITYKKGSPTIIAERTYFENIKKRYEAGKHIQSFGAFLRIFST